MLCTQHISFWLIFLPCVLAFYPFVPPYRCLDEGMCAAKSKRVNEDTGLFTLKLKQNVPVGATHKSKLLSVVDRAIRKYQGRNPVSRTINLPDSVEKRANAYVISTAVPPSLPMSAGLDQDGTDFSYFAVVNVGASAKAMYMLMDTGASDTWVMATSCTSAACTTHNTFGPADSKTFKSLGQPLNLNYGTGSVSGTYASDTFAFAGLSLNMTFGSANYTSNQFESFPFDGILGLSQAPETVPTFVQTLKTSKALASNIFAININRQADLSHDGEITFGGIDTTKFTGPITYTALVGTSGDWTIRADDAAINGKTIGAAGRTTFVDTGTSFIFMPAADAKLLHANIAGSSLSSDGLVWYVPCSTTTPLQFIFSGVTYSVPSKDWVGGEMSGLCTSNVYPQALAGAGNWLFGDTFLKNVYAVFDADKSQIGFGAKAVAVTSSASPVKSTSKTSVASAAVAASSQTPVTTAQAVATSASSIIPTATSNVNSVMATSTAISASSSVATPSTPNASASPSVSAQPFVANTVASSSSAASIAQASPTSPAPSQSATTTGAGARMSMSFFTATACALLVVLCLGL